MEQTIEELQTEVMATAGELGALMGGSVGSTLGQWVHADLQNSGQVAAKIAWVTSNCPTPERAELIAKLTELLNRLENTN